MTYRLIEVQILILILLLSEVDIPSQNYSNIRRSVLGRLHFIGDIRFIQDNIGQRFIASLNYLIV